MSGRQRIRFCSWCGQDLDAPDADLVTGKRECRPCSNARRREANRKACADTDVYHATGIPTGDATAYRREYMKAWRQKQPKTIRQRGVDWWCQNDEVKISREREECPFCGMRRPEPKRSARAAATAKKRTRRNVKSGTAPAPDSLGSR